MTVQTHRLKNGFRIVTENMPGLKSASVGIWVNAGGRHERIEQNGIAHFLEHMAFKGTLRRSSVQIAEAIEDVGGYINAYTSREMTAYYARVLADDVALALDVVSDIVLNPIFDPAEIEVERGVILSEIGQASRHARRYHLRLAARGVLSRSTLGPLDPRALRSGWPISRSAGPVDFCVRKLQCTDQMVLAAAGAVDHDELVRQCEEIFGDLIARNQSPVLQGNFCGGEIRQVKDLEQAHFALAFESPNYKNPDIYTAQIFSTAFGGGMSSRLFQEVREKRGLCYSIFASAGAYCDTGTMTIYSGTSGDKVAELANITMDELKRAADDMSEAEVARARAQMKAGLLMGLESPSSRAERLARMMTIWDRIPSLDEVVSQIDGVTTEAVRNFSGLMAGGAPAAMALYGPVADAPTIEKLQARLVA